MFGKKPLVTCVVLFVISGFFGWGLFPSRPRGPHLAVENSIEMGTFDHDEYKSLTVRLKNDGTESLVLEPILTGCTCTSGKLSKSELLPGESAEVSIRYHASQTPSSEIRQPVIIPSNCREFPQRQIMLHGSMSGTLVPIPATLAVGRVRPSEKWVKSVRVRHSDRGVVFDVTKATANVTNWDVSVQRVSESEFEIQIDSSGDADAGVRRGLILVESTLSAKPLEIPVSVDVRSELRVRPSPLLFSRNNVDTTEGPKYTEELVTIVGPKGMKLTPDQSALFSLVEQSMPNESDTEHSAEEVRFQIRVIGDTKSVKDGTITFSVEGVSNETRYAIPYLVVE